MEYQQDLWGAGSERLLHRTAVLHIPAQPDAKRTGIEKSLAAPDRQWAGIKVKNRNGGSYMQSGSFQMEKSAFIQLADMDLYLLFKRVDSYITEWEHCIAQPLISNGKEMLANQQAQRQQMQRQPYPYAA